MSACGSLGARWLVKLVSIATVENGCFDPQVYKNL